MSDLQTLADEAANHCVVEINSVGNERVAGVRPKDASAVILAAMQKAVALEDPGISARNQRIDQLERELKDVAEALKSASDTMACDARDWSVVNRDAWLYGLFCGWGNCHDEILNLHPRWGPDGIERLQRLRAAVVAVCDAYTVRAKEDGDDA